MTVASFIAAQRTDHRVPHVVSCRVLGVSQSWFYKWRDRSPTARQQRRVELDVAVKASFDDSGGTPGTYGSPRIFEDLIEAGWKVSVNTVAASMARQGLQGRSPKRKRRSLTRPDKAAAPIPDLIGRDFSAEAVDKRWCGDLTEIPTDGGKLYLATVLDLASRRLPGFAMGEHHDAPLARAALCMAAAVRGGGVGGVVFHSDKGGEYTGNVFADACAGLGTIQSMGRVGSALDKTLVSYCTFLGGFDASSLGEGASHAFDESGVAGCGRLVEAFVLVVGFVGGEEAGTVPGFDGGGADVEAVGGLGEGEQAAGLEPFGVAGELVGAA